MAEFQQCSGCYYWIARPSMHEETWGECRRNVPAVFVPDFIHRARTEFPVTDAASWCGKWESLAELSPYGGGPRSG